VAGVVLAAGLARRMGRSKLTLPWGSRTIIEHVVRTLLAAGCAPVVVVTGGWRAAVEDAVAHLPVRCVFNPAHADGSMTRSLQVGLRALEPQAALRAALVALGDQPGIPVVVVRRLLRAWAQEPDAVWHPEHGGRRGHPWVLPRRAWPALLAWPPDAPVRDFLRGLDLPQRRLPVATPAIHRDVDTPADYAAQRPT